MSSRDIVQAAAGVGGSLGYVEDVFSTYLYDGNGSTQTITNGIDLAGEGGLVWTKLRDAGSGHRLMDTNRGVTLHLTTTNSGAETSKTTGVTSFNTNGYALGSDSEYNWSSQRLVSWTFRKSPKFFDVVTYTGNGANRTIAHNLGAVPGMIIVKRTDVGADWQVYNRNLANTEYLVLNTTAATATGATRWNSTTPTSAVFSLGTDITVNADTGTYVAYLFAHDAGGFGDDGTENIVSCGSLTTDGSGSATVNLGWEAQYIIMKKTGTAQSWYQLDTSRTMAETGFVGILIPNSSSDAEPTFGAVMATATATGFKVNNSISASSQYIYLAIRRPMKTPTSGTEVYNAQTPSPTAVDNRVYTGVGFPPDAIFLKHRTGSGGTWIEDRLRGAKKPLYFYLGNAEDYGNQGSTQGPASFDQDGWTGGSNDSGQWDYNVGYTNVFHYFRRAPGFMDVVCDTGTGAAHTVSHNLTVAPELMIRKKRSAADAWYVYAGDATDYLILNTTAATVDLDTIWNDTAPTASVFTVGTHDDVNQSTGTFVTYLFATLPGISKVGSYTGNGSNQTINCGFSTGARFVLIKRTDSTGDWYIWDTARGIVAGNDPHLSLNTTVAEVTTDDSVDTDSTGFIVNQLAATNINVNTASYIFLSIS